MFESCRPDLNFPCFSGEEDSSLPFRICGHAVNPAVYS